MTQFRKKPVVIEATQWFKPGDHPKVRLDNPNGPWIDTLEGGHIVTPGDWIVTGVKGEHYPCKPDIFALTYEPADLAQQERKPMLDSDIVMLYAECPTSDADMIEFAREVEAFHGIRETP